MKLPKIGRIKPKYNPVPNAKERRHHERLQNLPCIACNGAGGVAHHLLSDAPGKRWRRDHEFVLPMCDPCHRALHGHGNELAWCIEQCFDPVVEATFLRLGSLQDGIL